MSEVPLHPFAEHTGAVVIAREAEYRGTSLKRKRNPLGPYSRTMPRVLGGS